MSEASIKCFALKTGTSNGSNGGLKGSEAEERGREFSKVLFHETADKMRFCSRGMLKGKVFALVIALCCLLDVRDTPWLAEDALFLDTCSA